MAHKLVTLNLSNTLLLVLIGFFALSTSAAGSPKWRRSSAIGDAASDQALEAVAARLSKLTNLSADPCDDFYEFACGGARREKEDQSIMYKLDLKVKSQLEFLISSPNASETKWLKLTRDLYKSYESRDGSRSANFKTIRQLVRRLGGIPALGERSGWIEGTQTNWTDLAVQLRRVGMPADLFYRWDVRQNHLNRSRMAIYLSLPYVYNLGRDHSRANYRLLVEKYLLPNTTKAEAARFNEQLEVIVEFRVKLSEIFRLNRARLHSRLDSRDSSGSPGVGFWPFKYLRSENFQSIPIKSLELLVPKVNWAGFLSDLFQYPVSSETDIFVHKPETFVEVQKLIQSQLNSETLRNFMMLEAVNKQYEDNVELDSPYRYQHRVGGLFNSRAYSMLQKELGIALSAEYVRTYLLPEMQASATIMVDYFRRELKNMIGEADWISDMAKQGALAKADAMISYVGYPDELLNETLLADLYSGLELEAENFLANLLSLNRWRARTESTILRQPFEIFSWQEFRTATNIDAFYRPLFNSINILPTMMQGFMYNSQQPNYVNFAALGSVVGQQIARAYDQNNIKYDCNGQDRCWWDQETGAEYLQRSKCFEQEYNGSQVFGDFSRLNGSLTLNENIADNIGAKIARRAYQSWLADQPAGFQEPLLDGDLANYNQDQLFWTSFAQFYCEKEQSYRGLHSPKKLRVDLTLSNQVEFAETFQCPLGSRMNPEDRCTMW